MKGVAYQLFRRVGYSTKIGDSVCAVVSVFSQYPSCGCMTQVWSVMEGTRNGLGFCTFNS